MKNRAKQLMALCLTASICIGNLSSEIGTASIASAAASEVESETEAAKQAEIQEKISEESMKEASKAEQATDDAEKMNGTSAEKDSYENKEIQSEKETGSLTEAPETETEKESGTSEEASETETEKESGTSAETSETETENESETSAEASETETENETESSTEAGSETESETRTKEELIVTDASGECYPLEQIDGPQQLTVGTETYSVDYREGVYRIYVPEGTQALQIIVPDQEEEKVLMTRWNGYVTEQDQTWLLYPDDTAEDTSVKENNTYTVDLENYLIDMEKITEEQLAVYGDLTEEVDYAEIFVYGENRSELLLVEYVPDFTQVSLLSAGAAEIKDTYTSAGKNLAQSAEKYIPTVSSINGEWQILGLARGNASVDQSVYDSYLKNVISTLKEKDGVLHTKKYTEYSRVVLALTSLGYDVTNVAGYNLLQPLADYDQTVWQGINGAAFALIAFDSHDYEIPTAAKGKTQNSREKLIETLLSQEVSGGGWDLSGKSADPDMTAMVIQSLAPYYNTNEKVKSAVDRGLAKLSAIQKSDGSYATYGSKTSESCAQVVVALTALGIDPNTDSRFIKNGTSVLEALIAFQMPDGSFRHLMKGSSDQMATEQAYYALTAYDRFINGKNRLYDMTDVVLASDREKAAKTEALIQALPEQITASEKDQVQSAWSSYQKLSALQKTLLSEANVTRLQNAVAALKEADETWQETEEETERQTENKEAQTEENNKKEESDQKKTAADKVAGGTTKKVNLVSGSSTGATVVGKKNTEDPEQTEAETEEETKTQTVKKGATKKDAEVTDLILSMNALFRTTKNSPKLPEDPSDYTDVQIQSILEIYQTYTGLSKEQQEQAEKGRYYEKYQEVLKQLGTENHCDSDSGTNLNDNEEENLPWYIRLEVSEMPVDAEQAEAVRNALNGQGELLNMRDISLENLLEGGEWQPEDLLRVSIPMADLGVYEQAAIVHLKEDGGMEFLTAHIAGSCLEFDTDHFSRFGIVGYNGTMEELMQEPEQNDFWIYLIPGTGAAALLAAILLLRIMSGKKRNEKENISE